MALIKAQVYQAHGLGSADRDRARRTKLMHESFRHPDAAEGVHSYLERRPPRFAPLESA